MIFVSPWREGGGGGETPIYKFDGGACQILKKYPTGTKIWFCGCGLKFVSPLRDTCINSKIILHIISLIFLS